MLKWVKAALIILFVATAFWMLLFFESLQHYREYVRDYYEEREREKQRILEKYGLHADFPPAAKSYWEWDIGGVVLFVGFGLLCAWIALFEKAMRDFLEDTDTMRLRGC